MTAPAKHVFSSGASSSKLMPRLDLVPMAALRLLADRFQLGSAMRGEDWSHRKAVDDDAFVLDRINHMIAHAFTYATGRNPDDLGAVLCNAAMLADIADQRRKVKL